MLSRRGSNEMSPTINTNDGSGLNSSDDESAPVQRTKKRVQQFSDSDTDNENVSNKENTAVLSENLQNDSGSESGNSSVPFKSGKTKFRIQMNESSSDSNTSDKETMKNEEQQIRMKNKRNKLKDKFKGLLSSREKHTSLQDNDNQSSEQSHSEISDRSDNEMSSVAKIKQKIKNSMKSMSSICDPDTSDEEDQLNKKLITKQKPKKQQKSTKLIEAKPVRMSAKQAMENMQLIKSESNRMLREKAVSLPYHKPKALSLKDIMSRRKPAVALDGKALPIKMNEEQLKHYALLLEQRQKEMMELCKSESDEEGDEKSDVTQQDIEQIPDITNNESVMITDNANDTVKCTENELIPNIDVASDLANTQMIENEIVETALTERPVNSEEVNDDEPGSISIVPDDPGSTSIAPDNQQENTEKNDSNSDFKLVYNDSVEEDHLIVNNTESVLKEDIIPNNNITHEDNHDTHLEKQITNVSTEPESQLISLHFSELNKEEVDNTNKPEESSNEITETVDIAAEDNQDDFFSDDDVNMEDIDRLIENAEILKDDDNISSPMVIRDPLPLNGKPTLMGAPGMVIDLDGGAIVPKKTGIELLKERFTYFARLKTPEELEREKEKKLKPGAQHLKLKQELEEQIAEQRSIEWAKRLEEEKQQHMEMDTILDDAEESFEKIEKKLDEEDVKENESSSESEEELEEDDIEIKDKPRKHNPMLDEEAEESDCEENEEIAEDTEANENIDEDGEGDDNVEQDDEEDESSEDESSESEPEEEAKPKKGRILKAFEDSDEEDATTKQVETETLEADSTKTNDVAETVSNEIQLSSQDDVIQLAQKHASASDDLFTSQESAAVERSGATDEVMTQTFSILDSTAGVTMDMEIKSPSKLCISQPYCDPSLNGVVGGSQLPTQASQSQPIGEDILALCTGKFYDNEFVTPTEDKEYIDDMSQDLVNFDYQDTQTAESGATDDIVKEGNALIPEKEIDNLDENKKLDENLKTASADGNILSDILGELDDPEFDYPKPNKYFTGGISQKKITEQILESTQMKKKFTIDSDDEETEINKESEQRKKKKLKKRKPEKRALQISDDEDEEEVEEEIIENDEEMSDLENETEKLVEYDSEENEIEIRPEKPKKKRKVADFFEQEAELTSEDEWVGSGDEDEKGLDRMEREEGDDEVFHQGQLRKELGQIHMRDVLDQDKREVRIIQELLFEDGDLGDGHRQRKFRWRNAGDEDETGTIPGEFADTQEEEFESEEQWRKQRHEREVFLRSMQEDEDEGNQSITVNRTTIIKANLSSKSMSTLLQEVNQSKTIITESPVVKEKKTAKDIPSPKKSFSIYQQNYHGSLLTRGRGALARLAALATPLAVDDDAPKIGSLATHKRNFVFTALSQSDEVPKVTLKRKADVNLGTPKLVKKMRIEEKVVRPKSSLLDHLNL